jgi:hypothetical protein
LRNAIFRCQDEPEAFKNEQAKRKKILLGDPDAPDDNKVNLKTLQQEADALAGVNVAGVAEVAE